MAEITMHNQLCCTVTLSIAVGCTRHWLAAKCASRSVKQAMTALLAPHQLGFGTVIQSAKGVQQGDPLGPLLFCLTAMGIMEHLRSELCIFYLDDCTLGGTV